MKYLLILTLSTCLFSCGADATENRVADNLSYATGLEDELPPPMVRPRSRHPFFVGLCPINSAERDADPNLAQMEAQIVQAVNNFRQQNGLAPLQSHPCLSRVAYVHSQNMASKRQAEHVLDGLDVIGRLRAAGVTFNEAYENLHYYYDSSNGQPFWNHTEYVNRAMDFWKNSPGHRENMLRSNMTHLGVGISKVEAGGYGYYYATQVIASI